ncbi:hypothetical protein RchiOBHm_Chr2g0126001 [Rosa chinensis]|uniref:Uncharacterized protein n=1 Tax=Rosa chinensis TaxID=74649 RepID=A0A2P6RTQ1_ROSCH|nr:hypothetical protein RchiOBHm_Chr2g0126001 [Rosa chinensis]
MSWNWLIAGRSSSSSSSSSSAGAQVSRIGKISRGVGVGRGSRRQRTDRWGWRCGRVLWATGGIGIGNGIGSRIGV